MLHQNEPVNQERENPGNKDFQNRKETKGMQKVLVEGNNPTIAGTGTVKSSLEGENKKTPGEISPGKTSAAYY